MSKQDIKEENKQQEGDPMLKGQIRAKQRQMARQRRQLEDVPQATVVVTNPTHIAVALKYDRGMSSPKVVAVGADLIAERIKKIARDGGHPAGGKRAAGPRPVQSRPGRRRDPDGAVPGRRRSPGLRLQPEEPPPTRLSRSVRSALRSGVAALLAGARAADCFDREARLGMAVARRVASAGAGGGSIWARLSRYSDLMLAAACAPSSA